ncbi:uncharacterized protein LOC127446853 [Myxocyprinus asiaticus]|uniref:uncharacterized protein LOC127446853 n=1 Tax=Myxocyprinus asiaticus TaxID=70543 RepID=UPI002223276E|nr:uncharacterized protein LOC127446853 [Myxocyprinus asiaticus]
MAISKTLDLCLYLLWCDGSFSEVELPFETRDKVDKSITAANSITSAILSWMEFKASPEKGAEMLVMQMEPDTETQKQQIATVQKLPSKRVALLLKSIRYMTPFLSTFSALGSVVSCLLAFIPQEDPVMTLLKKEFADVNRKLDEVSLKVSSLQRDMRWNNYASTYAWDEVDIQNGWEKFMEFTQSSLVATSPEEKKQLVLRFTEFYENTRTEGAVASFYRYLTQPAGPTLLENLLDLVVEKFEGDLRMVTQFTSYFTSLMTKGFQLDVLLCNEGLRRGTQGQGHRSQVQQPVGSH